MRLVISAAALCVALTLPTSAVAFSAKYTGDFAGDTSPEYSLVFKTGQIKKKDKFPKRVRDFKVTVEFSCFDSAGVLLSAVRRNDLAPGFFDGLKVGKGRLFSGTAVTPTGLTYSVAGQLGPEGEASGSMQITQGQKGSDNYCSTGTFADPNVQWTATYHPNSCCSQPKVVRSQRA